MTSTIPRRSVAPIVLFMIAATLSTQAAVQSKTVEYRQDTTALEGVLVSDASAKGKRPGILLVGDWMGVSDFARKQAEKVAQLGYVVLVADIYGKGVRPKDQKEAGTQAGIYRANRELMRARARAGLEQLLKSPGVDAGRTAAMGYCFGGGVVLELARSGADLDGVASFHGNLDTPHPEDARNIKGQVAVFHGADDPNVPAEQVAAFADEMRKAGVDWRLTKYGGAVHSFTNPQAGNDPSKGNAYNAKADRRSWEAMKDFYQEIFSAQPK